MYAIGTARGNNFESDTLGNHPDETEFPTKELAMKEIDYLIEHAIELWAENLENAAILDTVTNQIVWRQVSA